MRDPRCISWPGHGGGGYGRAGITRIINDDGQPAKAVTDLSSGADLTTVLRDEPVAAGDIDKPIISQAFAIEKVQTLRGEELAEFLGTLIQECADGDFAMGSLFLFSDVARRDRLLDLSLGFLRICGQRYGRSAALLEKLGFTYLATADGAMARDAFLQGLELEPENTHLQQGLYLAYVRLGDAEAALAAAEPIMARDDLFNPEHFNRSLTSLVREDYAVGNLERVARFVPVLRARGLSEPWIDDYEDELRLAAEGGVPSEADWDDEDLDDPAPAVAEAPSAQAADHAGLADEADDMGDAQLADDDDVIPGAFSVNGTRASRRRTSGAATEVPASMPASAEPGVPEPGLLEDDPSAGSRAEAAPAVQDPPAGSDTGDLAAATSAFVVATMGSLAGAERQAFLRRVGREARLAAFDLGTLLGIADACRGEGLNDVALTTLHVALETFGPSEALSEKLGYTCLALDDDEAARRHFLAGLEIAPASVHLREGLFFACHNLDLRKEAIAAAAGLLDAEDLYSQQHFVPALKDDVQAEYLSGVRGPLRPYFEFLRRHASDNLVSVRLADIYNGLAEFDLAYRIVKPIEDELLVDPWLTCIVAETYIGLGDTARAEKIMRPLLRRGDFHLRFFDVYARSLRSKADIGERFDEIMAAFADKPEPVREQVEFMLHLRSDALSDAFAVFLRNGPEFVASNQYPCLELAYRLMQDGSVVDADHIFECFERFDILPFNRMMLKVNILFARQDWEAAKVALASITTSDERQRTEVMLKQFELACFCRDFATAADLCRDLIVAADQIQGVLPSIYRYYGEIKDWGSVCALFLRYGSDSFNYDQVGSIVFRAFAQTHALPSLLEKINAIRNWEGSRDLRRLRASVMEQLSTDVAAVETALADPAVTQFEVTRRRLEVKRRLLVSNTPPKSTSGNVIYFCTNSSYRCGTAVAVMSLLKTNLSLCQNSKIYIMTDEEDGVSEEVFGRLSQRFLCDMEVKYASSFISDFVNLRSSYGVFTSGFELSESAYYRIFFAKHLAQTGGVKRAVYLDSDVLIVNDIGSMFNLNLRGMALAARRETLRPEVELAAAMHGINDEDYFNSGVLVFDFAHPDIEACLDRTIEAVYTAELLFHDQCALNIGFFGKTSFLKTRFNYFLPPSTADDFDMRAADIVHFLDRPKPWHSTYAHPAALVWLDRLLDLSEAIGGDLTMRVLADA